MQTLDFVDTTIIQSGVEVGVHWYWEIAGVSVHGQLFVVIWLVTLLLIGASLLGSGRDRIPKGWQNFMESVVEFTQDIAKNQLVIKVIYTGQNCVTC